MALGRRSFILGGLAIGSHPAFRPAKGHAAEADRLPPWTPGTLDIHHIDTGVGNATFILAPDGITILIDCGATRGGPPASTALRPDDSRAAGEWVARYALRHARAANRTTLDYIVATHVHPDHIGSPLNGDPRAAAGYTLTGLSQVDALMPADLVVDRGFPDYAPLPLIDALSPAIISRGFRRAARRASGSSRSRSDRSDSFMHGARAPSQSASWAATAAFGPAKASNRGTSCRRDRSGLRNRRRKKTTCRSPWCCPMDRSDISPAAT